MILHSHLVRAINALRAQNSLYANGVFNQEACQKEIALNDKTIEVFQKEIDRRARSSI